MKRVAIIDVGSNSIKCLVARRNPNGSLVALYENTLPVRISHGIDAAEPLLSTAALDEGSDAVGQLVAECDQRGPLAEIHVYATSAVRDAHNREEFAKLVYDRTDCTLQVLTGTEEARLIGRGILEDPALVELDSFCVADLGGGSLELIQVQGGEVGFSTSLQLGTVRLTERFVSDPRQPLQAGEMRALSRFVGEAVQASAFPLAAPLVGTGGIVTVWRSMRAHQAGLTLPEVSPELPRDNLESWLEQLQTLDWAARCALPGLPLPRADIVPVGFAILEAILGVAGAKSVHHSRYNLRYGAAAEALARLA